jgi:hypothetical protein
MLCIVLSRARQCALVCEVRSIEIMALVGFTGGFGCRNLVSLVSSVCTNAF